MSTEADLKVFWGKFSPYAQRVVVAVKEKGIPAEIITVNLPNKPAELLEANPIHGKVPTIVHKGKPVAESLVILEYLEDAFPEHPLLPADAYGKAQMRFWADYVYQLFSKLGPLLFSAPGSPVRETMNDTAAAGLKTLEAAMVSFSAEGPFFAGEKFGYVDVVLAPMVLTAGVLKNLCGLKIPGPDALPRFHKWCEAAAAHPSVKDTLPSVEEAVTLFKFVAQKRAAAAAAAK